MLLKSYIFTEQPFLKFYGLIFKEILIKWSKFGNDCTKKGSFFPIPDTCPNFEENVLLIVLAYSQGMTRKSSLLFQDMNK